MHLDSMKGMNNYFTPSLPFTGTSKKNNIAITLLPLGKVSDWLKKQDASTQNAAKQSYFDGTSSGVLALRNEKGEITGAALAYADGAKPYDFAALSRSVQALFPASSLKNTNFEAKTSLAKKLDAHNFTFGWGLNAYRFDMYKSKEKSELAKLVWPKNADKKTIEAHLNAIFGLRHLVNEPSNKMGPDELEKAVKDMAKPFEGKVNVIKDKQLLEKNFPLVYTVGEASPRRPRLIEMTWGKTTDPKVTLVGKGVCFDTGGLDIKPSSAMRFMKKDMGGAAHTIALAYLIMSHKLPVHLHLIIPAVENAIAGEAFRPGDIIKSRQGKFVENTNTDAEGRLILADALTYACEKSPELVIDYATLTGSARAALGPDIPAFFSTNEEHARALQTLSPTVEDPVWNMPLWDPYMRFIEASEGDIVNSAGVPGDLIYSALFLKSFLIADKKGKTPDWMHFDCYAWEQSGKAGRPSGGADTGLRCVFKFLQDRYG